MAIFHLRACDAVLIHIPKTGGSTIRFGIFGGDYEGPFYGDMPERWRPKFSFCFVRNPFDRLISAWKMFTTGMEDTLWRPPEDGDRTLSLEAFMNIVEDPKFGDGLERKTFEQKIRHHTIPQTDPINSFGWADFVGRYETYARDLDEVLRKVDWNGDAPTPHMNRTDRGAYQSYFTPTLRRRAEAFYHDDLARLGYRFEAQ